MDRENRHFGSNGAGGSNQYIFLWHAAFDGEEGELRKAPPVRKTGGEESHHQESPKKESQLKRQRLSAPRASGALEEAEKNKSLPVDDEAPRSGSAWEELRAAYASASGCAEMVLQDEHWLREQMELRGITPKGLLELVRGNPLSGFHTPMAGLQ